MKGKFKIISLVLLSLLLLIGSAFGCFAYAESADGTEGAGEEGMNITTDITTEGELPEEKQELAAEDEKNEANDNVFSQAFGYIGAYASELFCALTLICSMILTYACKKGIFPAIKSGVGLMSGAVKKIGESVDNAEEKAMLATDGLNERLKTAELQLSKLTDCISRLENHLTPDEAQAKKDDTVKEVLSSQINLLSELLIGISMPQKTKDRVSAKLARVVEAIEDYGE